jgi:hypothetical protein
VTPLTDGEIDRMTIPSATWIVVLLPMLSVLALSLVTFLYRRRDDGR